MGERTRRRQPGERERIETVTRRFIERHALLPESGRVVVAVSGGADSLCLLGTLDALCGPGKAWPEVELVVAHLDHGLRGAEAQADAQAVAARAVQLGWRCRLGTAKVARRAPSSDPSAWRGLEDAARRARYAFLRTVAREEEAVRILVGHTADDQAETLILNWLRGSGLTGLTGMRPLAAGIARPLLALRRGDTHAYCALRGWPPRDDATNADDRFVRNRLRHQLMPALKRFNPNLVPTLVRNADLLAEDESYLEATAADALDAIAGQVSDDTVALDAVPLMALPPALRRRVLRQAIALVAGGPASGPIALDARHIALVAALAAAQAATPSGGSAIDLPGGLVATADPERVLIQRRTPSDARARYAAAAALRPEPVPLPVPGSVEVPGTRWRIRATLLDAAAGALPPGMEALVHHPASTPSDVSDASETLDAASDLSPEVGTAADAGRAHTRAYLDAAAASEPLTVRTWQPGDRFRPLGMAGERKLQDYFVDAKVPRDERGRIPLVCGPNHLLWIAGYRIDNRARLTESTQRVLALRLEPLDAAPDGSADDTLGDAFDATLDLENAALFDVTPDYAGWADPAAPDESDATPDDPAFEPENHAASDDAGEAANDDMTSQHDADEA